MNHRGRSFTMLALAAAISGEAQAAVVAANDSFTLVPGVSSAVAVLRNAQLPPGVAIYFDNTFIGGNSQYVDASGQAANPFTNPPVTGFVVVCPDDPGNGSLLVDGSGQLVYTPDTSAEGSDTFSYSLSEYDDQGAFVDDDAGNISLTLQALTDPDNGLASMVTGRNRQQVARALDRMCANGNLAGNELATRCTELMAIASRGSEDINGIVAQITPEEALALRRLVSDVMRYQTDLVYRQQDAVRQGRGNDEVTLNQGEFSLLNYQGGNAGETASPWSTFISGQYDQTEYAGSDLEAHYDVDTASMTLGADYRLNQGWIAGAALGWAQQNLDFNEQAGTIDADIVNLIAYLSHNLGQLTLDLQLGYGAGDYDLVRNIHYSSIDTAANGNTRADLLSLSAQLDWNWSHNAWALRPYLRLDYLNAQIDGYTETGGMGWAIDVSDQDMEQWTTSLGVEANYNISLGWGVLVPGLNLSALNQSSRDYSPVSFSFVEDTSGLGDFALLSDGEDSLFYQYEINTVAIFHHGAMAYISYRGTADFEHADGEQISFGGRLAF